MNAVNAKVDQGYEIGRPSKLYLKAVVKSEKLEFCRRKGLQYISENDFNLVLT